MAGEIPNSFDPATDKLETVSARFYEGSEGGETYEARVVVPGGVTPVELAAMDGVRDGEQIQGVGTFESTEAAENSLTPNIHLGEN